jgi:hypothetical protein
MRFATIRLILDSIMIHIQFHSQLIADEMLSSETERETK